MTLQATASAIDIADDQTLHKLPGSARPEHFKDEEVTEIGEAQDRAADNRTFGMNEANRQD